MKLDNLNRVIELAQQLATERQEGEAVAERLNRLQRDYAAALTRIEGLRLDGIRNGDVVSRLREAMNGYPRNKTATTKEVMTYLAKHFEEECPF